MNIDVETYALGLAAEEMGEALQLVGKALRFGIDTPGVKDPLTGVVDPAMTPRTKLASELGDVLAMIDYMEARGVITHELRHVMQDQRYQKFHKLTNPNVLDNMGRRLAP